MSWVIWITGLPGSGKSTVADIAAGKAAGAVVVRMDELRKVVTPEPVYSEEERDYVYRALVYHAKSLYDLGHNVIIDATGNRRKWRQLARELVPVFYEVYLACPAALCRERESTRRNTRGAPEKIYEKGSAGWPVPGIHVPYEEPEKPELVIDTEKESPEEAAEKIIKMVHH